MTRFQIRRRLKEGVTSVVTYIFVGGKKMLCKIRGDGKHTKMECTPLSKNSPINVADELPHKKKARRRKGKRKKR